MAGIASLRTQEAQGKSSHQCTIPHNNSEAKGLENSWFAR
jgi:hypothetical protein